MLHPTTSVSVVIPARNEARTVGTIVAAIVATGAVHEVIVVDDGSTDTTAAIAADAGARVLVTDDGPGKGAAMQAGVAASEGEVVVFCDADLEDFDPSFVTRLSETLVAAGGDLALVKADYERAGEGGRVTELTARPVLQLLHPDVAHIAQPLGGEYAAWRSVLGQVPFVKGYGVEVGLLLDVAAMFGPSAIGEAHLGVRRHRNRSLNDLGPQARDVLAVAMQRAGVATAISVDELPPLASAASRSPRRSA